MGGHGRLSVSSARLGGLASALTLLGLAALVPSAGAAFSAPVDVATGADNSQVATNANGDSAIAWEFLGTRIQGRTMSAAGALGPVQELGTVSNNSDLDPRVAIDDQGDVVFCWRRVTTNQQGIYARRLSAAGTLGGAQSVSQIGHNTSAPQVATDDNGDTVFTWVDFSFAQPRVQARTMSARGVLGTTRNVSPSGQIGSSPQVATDASGDSALTWVREDGIDGDGDKVQARTMTVNASLGPVTDLSAPNGRAFAPQVASDPDGDTVFTWARFDGIRDRVQARTLSSAGSFSPSPVNVTPTGRSAILPQVDIDATGNSVFAWERTDQGTDRIQRRTMDAAGALGTIGNVSAIGGEAFSQDVASADSGAGIFTWVRFDGTADRIQARKLLSTGGFGPITDLSAAGADAEAPAVAIADTTGAVVATWTRAGAVQATIGP